MVVSDGKVNLRKVIRDGMLFLKSLSVYPVETRIFAADHLRFPFPCCKCHKTGPLVELVNRDKF
jgi:hypothetical protein